MVRIRPITPDDKDHILDGFRRLSPESRYLRFLSPIDELPPDMLRDLTEVDYVDRFAYVGFALDVPGAPLGIGVARYVRLEGNPGGGGRGDSGGRLLGARARDLWGDAARPARSP
jgi:hypothetical protein